MLSTLADADDPADECGGSTVPPATSTTDGDAANPAEGAADDGESDGPKLDVSALILHAPA